MIVPIAVSISALLAMVYGPSEAKTVLMLPPPTKSYIIYHSNIAKALIDLGHNVTLCVPAYLINKNLVPFKEINILRYGDGLGDIEAYVYRESQIISRFWAGETFGMSSIFRVIVTFKHVATQMLGDNEFITSLRGTKPDFMILENFSFMRNLFVLPYKLGVPFGLIGTTADYYLTRVPFSPAGEVLPFEVVGNRKAFFDRVYATIMSTYFYFNDVFTDKDIVTRFAPEKPYSTINNIALTSEIFIIELDHILDYPRTSLPNTKFVGGSSVSEAKPLTGNLKAFVDKSSNGVIVVSFGGGDIQVPEDIKSKMLDAFRKLDQNVVWKIDLDFDQQGNRLPLKWLPQNDLLGHEKTKLFISHCGKNGQYEALYHSVPILCLPIYGDQFYNSIRISTKEFGLQADIRKITSDEFAGVIKQLIELPKYKTNIQKASTLFKELYKVPSKEVAYWFDHVMKYGGEYMRSSYQKMPLYEFLLLDVIAFLLAVAVAILLTLYVIVRFCCKLVSKFRQPKLKTA